VTHVELSLSSSVAPDRRPQQLPLELARWVAAVTDSAEPALVIDASAVVIACTPAGARLLGLPHTWLGERLPDALRLIDFTAAGSELPETDRELIPPLLAVASGRLARGLMRVRDGFKQGEIRTLDAIATPLHADGVAVGSLTFLCEI
jgi:hypothetical protein